MRFALQLSLAVLPVLFASPAAVAQQPARRPMPTMTSDDLRPAAAPAMPDAGKPADPAKPTPADPKAATPSAQEAKKDDPAAAEWNEKLAKARERVKDFERRADQSELIITRLRNTQFSAAPQDAGLSGQINARVAELTNQVRLLRAEARAAQGEVDNLLNEGAAKGYEVKSLLSPTTKTGEANLEYYRARAAELRRELSDAEQRIQVLQFRINDLNLRMRKNSGGGTDSNGKRIGGDIYFINRLREELREAQNGLELAQARITAANQQFEELRRQASLAGVPPGELR